jgi:hypothetical protein
LDVLPEDVVVDRIFLLLNFLKAVRLAVGRAGSAGVLRIVKVVIVVTASRELAMILI